ncbi:hypothetical protein [Methylosinus sp. PW1]|uniref:hypothetical protein n=1 Tax=Methylosinus sp. PW1 TaxID=107636 RepID=UPI0012EB2251|nr:hypothetical protein [Methylosinus sp. PW1]
MEATVTFPKVTMIDQRTALVEFKDGKTCRVWDAEALGKGRDAILELAFKARWEALGPETQDSPKVERLPDMALVMFGDGEMCRVWDEQALAKGREAILEIAYRLRKEALGPDETP